MEVSFTILLVLFLLGRFATVLIVEPLLTTFHNRQLSSNPASSLSLYYFVYHGSFFSNHCHHYFICYMFRQACNICYMFIRSSPCPHFKAMQSFYILFSYVHVSDPHSTTLHPYQCFYTVSG